MSNGDVVPDQGGQSGVGAPDKIRRRLAVILASDVAGYSRLVAADEEGTIRRFASIAKKFHELVTGHDGRVFNTAGDAILAEFKSAVDAVRCALDIHEATASLCKDVASDRQLAFRIGIAVGDVMLASNGDLLGDGVNIAARLQTLAAPAGICVSDEVRSHVQAKVELGFHDLGFCNLKNIPRPVRAFTIGARNAGKTKIWSLTYRLPAVIGVAVALLVVGIAVAFVHGRSQATILHPFQASDIPFFNDRTQRMLGERYGSAPLHKALAVSRGGFGLAVSQSAREEAAAMAIFQCSLKPGDCDVFASDEEVVWPRPLPMLPIQDVRSIGVDAYQADALPLPIPTELHFLHEYDTNPIPKALAIGSKGYIGRDFGQDSLMEAVRIARQRCADRNGSPCQIYAVNDQSTQLMPTINKPIGYFIMAAETSIPAEAREKLAAVYRGKDWRALVQGEDNSWFAVEDRKTEMDAVTAALAECQQSHSPCALIAVGDYLIHKP